MNRTHKYCSAPALSLSHDLNPNNVHNNLVSEIKHRSAPAALAMFPTTAAMAGLGSPVAPPVFNTATATTPPLPAQQSAPPRIDGSRLRHAAPGGRLLRIDGGPGTSRVAALEARMVAAVAARVVAAVAVRVPTIHTRVAADGSPCAG